MSIIATSLKFPCFFARLQAINISLTKAKPEGIVDLGIIEGLLRPALTLKDGLIEPLHTGPWQKLPIDLVQQLEKSMCRLDILVEGYLPIHVGTGFVVGNDASDRTVVMTNAHIVEAALRYGWTILTGMQFVCDFARYSSLSEAEGHLFSLTYEHTLPSTLRSGPAFPECRRESCLS